MPEPSKGRSALRSLRRIAVLLLVNLMVLGLLLALLEGAASLLLIGHEILSADGVPEDVHAEHDELLGWVNRPDVYLPNMYGPGVEVRINGQRFRNARNFTPDVPAGRLRVICSGDSFTFGYGVSNEEAWCQRLTALDPRLETVNMGLGGYGVDQAYLWYMRDGTGLDHDIQIFAFLTDDFRRMRSDRFMGYGKPLLALRGDSIVVENLPVPRTTRLTRWRALHAESIGRLNVVRLAQKVLGLDHGTARVEAEDEEVRLRAVVARLFSSLREVNQGKGSRLVLVYFPGVWDYMGDDVRTESWRRFVQAEAERQGVPFLDLVEELRKVPPTEVDGLYAPNAHFSVAGNDWAARVLYGRLEPVVDSLARQKTGAPSPSVYGGQPGGGSPPGPAR